MAQAGPVPADHLDAGMLAQPLGKAGGFPVGQQVYRAVGVHVDQDAAESLLGPPLAVQGLCELLGGEGTAADEHLPERHPGAPPRHGFRHRYFAPVVAVTSR